MMDTALYMARPKRFELLTHRLEISRAMALNGFKLFYITILDGGFAGFI
jgi:hypothetical protein